MNSWRILSEKNCFGQTARPDPGDQEDEGGRTQPRCSFPAEVSNSRQVWWFLVLARQHPQLSPRSHGDRHGDWYRQWGVRDRAGYLQTLHSIQLPNPGLPGLPGLTDLTNPIGTRPQRVRGWYFQHWRWMFSVIIYVLILSFPNFQFIVFASDDSWRVENRDVQTSTLPGMEVNYLPH